jgi:hypothetical protein
MDVRQHCTPPVSVHYWWRGPEPPAFARDFTLNRAGSVDRVGWPATPRLPALRTGHMRCCCHHRAPALTRDRSAATAHARKRAGTARRGYATCSRQAARAGARAQTYAPRARAVVIDHHTAQSCKQRTPTLHVAQMRCKTNRGGETDRSTRLRLAAGGGKYRPGRRYRPARGRY